MPTTDERLAALEAQVADLLNRTIRREWGQTAMLKHVAEFADAIQAQIKWLDRRLSEVHDGVISETKWHRTKRTPPKRGIRSIDSSPPS